MLTSRPSGAHSVEEHQKTVQFDDMTWLAPVESVEVLPVVSVVEGALCYVQTENAVYGFTQGVWVKQSSKGSPEPGPRSS